MPCGDASVSPCTTSTSSKGTPSASAAIWLQHVTWPWPCGLVPVTTSTLPVGSMRMLAASQPPAEYRRSRSTRLGASPHISVYVDTPMPSRTVSPRALRSACSARSLSYSNRASAFSVAAS